VIEKIAEISHHMLEHSTRMLAKAFQDDPLFKYVLPDAKRRKKRLPALFALNLQYGLIFGEVYSIAQQGLAIWLPPGNSKITIRRAIQAGMWLTPLKIGLGAIFRLASLNSISEGLHERFAPDPHWYLFLFGVDPASQGRGLGSLLLQPVLARADAACLPCYLETNNPSTVRFYQKHGFVIAAKRQTTVSNLSLWAMRRESR
jgi:GNAT superfamily N-acetyltransferase